MKASDLKPAEPIVEIYVVAGLVVESGDTLLVSTGSEYYSQSEMEQVHQGLIRMLDEKGITDVTVLCVAGAEIAKIKGGNP